MTEVLTFNPEAHPELVAYYNQVRAGMSREQAIDAVAMLVRSAPVEVPITRDMLIEAQTIASEDVYAANLNLARDIETVLPLVLIAPHLEASRYDIEKLGDWYDTVIREIQYVAPERHDIECLEYAHPADYRCRRSSLCPPRFLEMYFGDCAKTQDFTSPEYLANPVRADLLVGLKLTLGRQTEILSEAYVQEQLAHYQKRVDARSSDSSLQSDA